MKNKFRKILHLSVLFLFCICLTSCSALFGTKTARQEIETLKLELEKTNEELALVKKEVESQKIMIRKLKDKNTLESKQELKEEAAEEKKTAYTEPILLYKEGRALLLEEKYDSAIKVFSQFLDKYPHNDLADNALYWIGECHYAVTDFNKAIEIFKEVVEKYPRGMKVPDALLKTAYSYISLKDNDRAHHYLKLVVEKYPFSDASEKAQIKLKTFQ